MKTLRKNIPAGSRTCKWKDNGDYCRERNAANSKYCQHHKQIAKEKFLVFLKEEKEARERNYKVYEAALLAAAKAGLEAGNKSTPNPMIVQKHENMLDDSSPIEKEYFVEGGVCGFAYVIVTPGTSSFARYLSSKHGWSKYYYGGVCMSVKEYGQSYERKMAYAEAYANTLDRILSENNLLGSINIMVNGRLD